MLDITKNINVLGTSKIKGVVAVNFSTPINSKTGAGNITTYIVDADLYNANRTECRKDFADYTSKVYEIEDQLLQENKENNKSEGAAN